MSRVIVHVDGGARGNPGPAGWGAVIQAGENPPVELHGSIGRATNNVAEYTGLVEALRWCEAHGATEVHVRSDSLLMVQQMRGVYKVRNEGLKPLHGEARLLSHRIGRVTFEHVRRELNREADRLANRAMDDATD